MNDQRDYLSELFEKDSIFSFTFESQENKKDVLVSNFLQLENQNKFQSLNQGGQVNLELECNQKQRKLSIDSKDTQVSQSHLLGDFTSDLGENKKTRKCTCLKTRCRKNYCECFRMGIQCGQQCQCLNCSNKVKLFSEPISIIVSNIKCKCQKSKCNKKYCQCHSAGKKCSQECNCRDCQNCLSSKNSVEQPRKKVKTEKFDEFQIFLNLSDNDF